MDSTEAAYTTLASSITGASRNKAHRCCGTSGPRTFAGARTSHRGTAAMPIMTAVAWNGSIPSEPVTTSSIGPSAKPAAPTEA